MSTYVSRSNVIHHTASFISFSSSITVSKGIIVLSVSYAKQTLDLTYVYVYSPGKKKTNYFY